MLDNFPLVREDELLYGIIGRYHRDSGNKNIKVTFLELFDRDTIVPVVDLPCNLEYLTRKFPNEMNLTSDKIIYENTLFPLYSPFMTLKKKNELLNMMKYENGVLIKYIMGIMSGSVCRKTGLYYCPECAKSELEQYGEAQIHRTHQVQGVYVCEKHSCFLHVYSSHNNSKLTVLLESKLNFRNLKLKDSKLQTDLTVIAKEVHLLLNDSSLTGLNIDCLRDLYLKELKERGYLTNRGLLRRRVVFNDFSNYYGLTLLAFLESELKEPNQYNWLKLITSQQKTAIHPIRHLLFIGFLFGSVKRLLEIHQDNSNAKESLGLCLNPVCQYFQKPSVTDIKITSDHKTRESVLTFTCQCGFSYSRKEKEDALKIGAIKSFGHVWESALIDVIHSNKSLRAIAKQMKCDRSTVVKYAEKLGMKHLINSRMTFEKNEVKSKVEKIDPHKYKMDVLRIIQDKPTITRQEVKDSLRKQCSWLYRNDREWYEENLPKVQAQVRKVNKKYLNGYWENVDSEILDMLVKEYDKVMVLEKPVRVTISLLGKRIDKLAILQKRMDKLPKTKAYIHSITETVEEFHRRKVRMICKKLTEAGESLVKWKITMMAGLKDSKIVSEIIKSNTFQ